MRLLLDTHIWLWGLSTPERLSPRVRSAMAVDGVQLLLSAISVWEALVLIRKGRLEVDRSQAQKWVRQALAKSPVEEVAITFDIAIASEHIALDHADPADRFIAATALVLDVTLVTADARLIACTDITVLAQP